MQPTHLNSIDIFSADKINETLKELKETKEYVKIYISTLSYKGHASLLARRLAKQDCLDFTIVDGPNIPIYFALIDFTLDGCKSITPKRIILNAKTLNNIQNDGYHHACSRVFSKIFKKGVKVTVRFDLKESEILSFENYETYSVPEYGSENAYLVYFILQHIPHGTVLEITNLCSESRIYDDLTTLIEKDEHNKYLYSLEETEDDPKRQEFIKLCKAKNCFVPYTSNHTNTPKLKFK